MEALSHLRQLIASLDEALVDALCARAVKPFDESHYAMPDEPAPGLQGLAQDFAEAPTLAGRIQALRPSYLRLLLPSLCPPARAGQPSPPSLSADAACLDALARRLALSVHVATRKRESIPPALQAAIETGDPRRVEQAITHPDVEQEVLARIRARAAARVPADPALPDRLASLYADWIIPLSRKIQVFGLLANPQ